MSMMGAGGPSRLQFDRCSQATFGGIKGSKAFFEHMLLGSGNASFHRVLEMKICVPAG